MLPPPERAMLAAPWRNAWKVPFRFSETTRSNSSSFVSARRFRTFTPGVETSPRGWNPSDSSPSNRFPTASAERMSTDRATAVPPSRARAATTRPAAASSRSATTTRAPERRPTGRSLRRSRRRRRSPRRPSRRARRGRRRSSRRADYGAWRRRQALRRLRLDSRRAGRRRRAFRGLRPRCRPGAGAPISPCREGTPAEEDLPREVAERRTPERPEDQLHRRPAPHPGQERPHPAPGPETRPQLRTGVRREHPRVAGLEAPHDHLGGLPGEPQAGIETTGGKRRDRPPRRRRRGAPRPYRCAAAPRSRGSGRRAVRGTGPHRARRCPSRLAVNSASAVWG